MNPVKLYKIITKQLKVKQEHLYYHFWVVEYISCKKIKDFSSSLYIGFLSYCPGSLHDINFNLQFNAMLDTVVKPAIDMSEKLSAHISAPEVTIKVSEP